jgi:putative membrane protein
VCIFSEEVQTTLYIHSNASEEKKMIKHTMGMALLHVAALALCATAATAQGPDDAAIAHIAVTANQLDVTGAEQALQRSSNEEVRAFAETMIRDHTGVIEQAAALAKRLGVTPRDNETSRALASQAARVRDDLAELRGSAFDRAYMENEVAYHETVISAIEQTLVPNASNAELKQLLEGVVPAFRAHLEHARRLGAELRGR